MSDLISDTGSCGFNPRSPPKRRATTKQKLSSFSSLFQSTLPSEKESDEPQIRDLTHKLGFNPRSPPKRRATSRATDPACCQQGFNPRSPPKRRATTRAHHCTPSQQFQSTLPSEKESDIVPRSLWHRRTCFNPRSPPKRRATTSFCVTRHASTVSIHAPLRKGERRRGGVTFAPDECVSIHAPLRKGERQQEWGVVVSS